MRHAEKNGMAAGEELARFVKEQIYSLKDVVEKESIDCELELRRSYDVFTSERDAQEMQKAWTRFLERGDEWTRDVSWIGPDLAERLTSVKGAKGAFSVPACSLWPYKLVTGLLERTMERNNHLNVQTETPALRTESVSDGSTLVHTSRGSVKAKKVIFATNAYTAALIPQYHGIITPYKGTAAHLAPIDAREPVFPHLSDTYNLEFGLIPGRDTVDYLNPRPDGGIVVGGGKWIFEEQRHLWYNTVDDSTLIEPIIEAGYFEGYMQRVFKGWQDSGSKAEKIWTGIMGATPDGLPHVGKVPGQQAQWILAGFNGGGMSLIYLCAKAIAKMAMDGALSFDEMGVGVLRLFETTGQRLRLHESKEGPKDIQS